MVAIGAAAVALLGVVRIPIGGAASAVDSTPPWVKHVRTYSGGISNGPRASLAAADAGSARAASASAPASPDASGPDAGGNLQMNTDSTPPVPQNETSVA